MGYFNKKVINWSLLLQVFFTTLIPNYIIVSYSVEPMMNWNKTVLDSWGIKYDNVTFSVIFFVCIFIIPFIIHNIKWFQTETSISEENQFLKKNYAWHKYCR